MQSNSIKPARVQSCSKCGQPLAKRQQYLHNRYCSKKCSAIDRYKTITERFWDSVLKTDSCWLWTGCLNSHGYGDISHQRRHVAAHRLSWELNVGPIPNGLSVLHNCPSGDNRACVNPSHLWLGTTGDNMRDAASKGTLTIGNLKGRTLHPESFRGELIGTSKLTEDKVRAIRLEYSRYVRGQCNLAALAKRYGVHLSAISRVIRRQTWRHVV